MDISEYSELFSLSSTMILRNGAERALHILSPSLYQSTFAARCWSLHRYCILADCNIIQVGYSYKTSVDVCLPVSDEI